MATVAPVGVTMSAQGAPGAPAVVTGATVTGATVTGTPIAGSAAPRPTRVPAADTPRPSASGAAAGSRALTRYPARAYGSDPRPRNAYDSDGWGTGYATAAQLGVVRYSGGSARVRKQLVPLVRRLFWLTENVYGYKIRPGQTFGYAKRPVRGGSRISNHGRGLAIDINSLSNPMSYSFRSTLPPQLVRVWEQHGFDWGGYYKSRPDTMHFEFADNVKDVKRYAASARKLVIKHEKRLARR